MNARKFKSLITEAQNPSFWDFGNKFLYDLCRNYPDHEKPDVAATKVWIIGRSYAAAIERRKESLKSPNDFYISRVAPIIVQSEIDAKIQNLRLIQHLSLESIGQVIDAHEYVTNLFRRISGLEKRSLASKYLHFHAPNLVFIYDSRAVKGLRNFSGIIGRSSQTKSDRGDNPYRIFAEKCLNLRDHISKEYHVDLSPRQIDNLLLKIS